MEIIPDDARLKELIAAEEQTFIERHPRSKVLYDRAHQHLMDGVPMNWMTRWASPFPPFVQSAQGARFTCVDGHTYIDFCLGDTGAMTGHSPGPTIEAVRTQLGAGITTMLPSEDALWVGEELARRFGLQYWQVAMTATDANRYALRIARKITRRPKVLVFNWCYHGSVDEALATLGDDGQVQPRTGNIGPAVTPDHTTKVIEFNDVARLQQALEPCDVAAVLCEPALTNIGIVLPQSGYHEALRRLTRETGTLLIVDETHTICAGPGGCTGEWRLEPDMLTIGKPIGGGIPCSVYGFGQEVADRMHADWDYDAQDASGVGGTLSGNVLQLAAIRATLGEVFTDEAFAHMIALARRFNEGVQGVIDEFRLPWVVERLGCRTEYWPRATLPVNGGEAAAAENRLLDRFLHLFALNRGILMTPFHNMALIAPCTDPADIDRHTEVFREAAQTLTA